MADLNIANKGADDLVDEVIVEKVARALCAKEWLPESGWTFEMEVSDPSVKLYWMDCARAAIEAYTAALADLPAAILFLAFMAVMSLAVVPGL